MKRIICLLILSSVLLASCGTSGNAPERQDNGAGRIKDTEKISNSETAAGTESESGDAKKDAGSAAVSGSAESGNLEYHTWDGRTITDFSAFDGLSRNFFSDTGDPENGSWYTGKTTWDEASKSATLVWDRAADVLDAIEKYDVIYRKTGVGNTVYFTFDCGYEHTTAEYPDGVTNRVLDILKEKNVKGIFFLNLQYLKTSSDIVKRMLDEGHIVANHGANHMVMSKLSVDEFISEIEEMNTYLREQIPDAPYMKYYRPPYGSCSEWDLAMAKEMGLTTVLYSWTYFDYDVDNQKDPSEALEIAKDSLYPGQVIMLHTVSTTNAEILGDFIDYIRSQGFEIGSFD